MLESFYNEFVANKATERPYYKKFSLASSGISHYVFQSALGELQENSHWRNRSAPDFKVVGITCVPVALDGHLFTLNFFLLDDIFSSHGLEAAIFFILTQWTGGHELLKPPPLVTDPVNDPAASLSFGSPCGLDELCTWPGYGRSGINGRRGRCKTTIASLGLISR